MKPSLQKKILVVAESIDVEDSSGSKANVALILNLRDAGYDLVVYHYTRKKVNLPEIESISIREKKFNSYYFLSRAQRKMQHGLKINLAKYLEPKFGFSFTFFNDTDSIVEALGSIEFEPDLVLTLSKGASFRPHYALLQVPHLHKKWLAYIHDPYPFHYYPEPYKWSEPGYREKIKFFRRVSEKCRWAGFPSLLLAEWMETKFPGFKGKRIVLPHQLGKGERNTGQVPDFFDPERFTVLHAGSLLKQRSPFALLKAYRIFLKRNPEARTESNLLLLGSNTYHRKELEKEKASLSQLILSEGYVSYPEVRALQNQVSVNVILEAEAEISPFLPGKFPHCVAANRPVLLLGPARSECRRLLGEGYLYWAEADDEEKTVILLEKLYLMWKNDPASLVLDRRDLIDYLSVDGLKRTLNEIW